ncbi:hypothetical protein DPV78_004497 [Talaromyces pinophilus]|nr:hypothetical protein DPV78_004497 [Talaromyces pinophilus]
MTQLDRIPRVQSRRHGDGNSAATTYASGAYPKRPPKQEEKQHRNKIPAFTASESAAIDGSAVPSPPPW